MAYVRKPRKIDKTTCKDLVFSPKVRNHARIETKTILLTIWRFLNGPCLHGDNTMSTRLCDNDLKRTMLFDLKQSFHLRRSVASHKTNRHHTSVRNQWSTFTCHSATYCMNTTRGLVAKRRKLLHVRTQTQLRRYAQSMLLWEKPPGRTKSNYPTKPHAIYHKS